MSFDFSKYTEEQALELMYPRQKEAYLECKYGDSDVLVVSSGGTGKSFIIAALMHYSKDTLATGTTGVAAVNIEGQTTHSTLSIPLGIPTKKDLAKINSKYRQVFKKNHGIRNIIIDEFPMFGVDSLEGLLSRRDRVTRTSRYNKVRLLMFGDLYQLPSPVQQRDKKLLQERYGTTKLITSKLFSDMDLSVYELDQNKRSGEDKVFADVLEDLREGKNIEGKVLPYLNKHVKAPDPEAVYLTPHIATADKINKVVFDENTNREFSFKAKISGDFPEKDRQTPEVIVLKEGLRVMSLTNDTENELYVNGSCGVITNLYSDFIEVTFDNGNVCMIEPTVQENTEYYTDEEGELQKKVVGTYEQIGLRQCAAINIHKVQGLSLDKIVLDLTEGSFEYGMTYVAVSRLTNINGLHLITPIQLSDIKVDEDVKKFYAELRGEIYEKDPLQGVPEKYHKYKVRLIVAGGRDFNDRYYGYKALDFMLKNYKSEEVLIIDGGATGSDRIGREYAIERGVNYETFEADWKDLTKTPCKIKTNAYGQYNCLAGLVRNKEMGDLASHAVVFWDGRSTGSNHMIEYMKELGKPVKIFNYG